MLVQPNAAEVCFRVKHTREVHIHARNLDAWDQEYEQTSPGVFHGEVRELFDHDLQVFEEMATCATSQHCRTWQGGIWVGLAVPEAPRACASWVGLPMVCSSCWRGATNPLTCRCPLAMACTVWCLPASS